MDKDQLLILIEKYLDREASEAEKRWVEQWYASFEHADDWLEAGTTAAAAEQTELKHLLSARLSGIAQVDAVNRQVFDIRRRTWKRWAVAVAAVLIAAAVTLGVWRLPSGNTNQVVKAGSVPRYIVLPDGSTVWLNAGSTITYAAGFSGRNREVDLEGEAYFDVVPQPGKSFLVRSGNLTTRVLGTAFCVKAYKKDNITVTVVAGRVQVNSDVTVMATLNKNERLHIRPEAGVTAREKIDSNTVNAWDTGLLQFEKQDLRDITTILGKWHGYTFSFRNPAMAHCIYTGSLDHSASLEEQLSLLSEVNNMTWNMDTTKKIIWIDGTGCNEQ
ncbi:FecR family protein [Chitinophaga sp.]|uniref:FecR family protein n=1 Tax=Chitinophaga sp. TaxID=1869181 RepID=UPI002F92759D